jgi:hypothetical protein
MFFLVSATAFFLMVGMVFPPLLIPGAFFAYLIYRLGRKRLEADNRQRAQVRARAHNKAVRYFSS